VEAIEAFPGVQLWETFDEACAEAEAVRERVLEEAAKERDRIVNALCSWNVHAPNRIKAAAYARWEVKTKAAKQKCDAACNSAEEELMKALDLLEKARVRVEAPS
jgi:hypothetical protein